jgi:putative peptidoglycan lipid II flippase
VAAAQGERTRRLAVSTMLFSVATGLSRIIGLVREIAAGRLLGAEGPASAFVAANNVPNTVRSLVADAALGASFVPVFNELLEKGEDRRAWRVASTVLCVSGVALTAITAAGMLLAQPILELSGFSGEQLDLAVRMAQVLFPILILLGLSGVINAMLYSFDEFFVPAIAPVAWNVVILGFLVWAWLSGADTARATMLYAVGTLVGTAVQFLLPLPWLRNRGGRLQLSWDIGDPAVRRIFVLMLPVALGLGLININQTIGTFMATHIGDGTYAPRAIDAAFRVYMLPQGIFAVAVAAVLFPSLSRLVAAGDMGTFRTQVSSGVRQLNFVLIPSAVVCAVLAEPIIRLLFQGGNWTADQTPGVAHALTAFAVGLAANGSMLLLNRSFFALQRPWLPTTIALGNLLLNTALNVAFLRFGVWGIPLATSLTNIVSILLLWRLLERTVGSLDRYRTIRALVRVLVASTILGAVAYETWHLIDTLLGRSLGAQLLAVATACTVGGVVYLWVARRTRIEEATVVMGMFRRRLRRS